ncbi:MAG: hypothetical protein AABZ55_11025 [Bdellovibrionota bacterium]
MPLDSDVVLLGTGAAPLVAASQLLSAGKSVLLLNPDFDFFLEDSELPLDPLLPGVGGRIDRDRFFSNTPERVVEVLRPHFPGAVEFKAGGGKSGFHDTQAPHVRARGRLWVAPAGKPEAWDAFENLYLEASEGDFKPQILEGAQASHRFPGCQSNEGAYRGLYIPKMCDVDVSRYRNGLLEFVRERLGPERVVCDAVQIEIMHGGVRFYPPPPGEDGPRKKWHFGFLDPEAYCLDIGSNQKDGSHSCHSNWNSILGGMDFILRSSD